MVISVLRSISTEETKRTSMMKYLKVFLNFNEILLTYIQYSLQALSFFSYKVGILFWKIIL